MSEKVILEMKDIVKDYSGFKAVDHVDFSLHKGEIVAIIGPSGSGKSTLLRCINALEPTQSGRVRLGNETVAYGGKGLTSLRQRIGMVFQSYALFPTMSVYDNIAFGMKVKKASKTEIDQKVHEVAAKIKITESQLKKNVSDLSGGQQQRVALARAIVLEPKILCLDEPLSNLDAKLRIDMRMELKRLQKELGITTLYVTHDQEEALTLSDRIAVFNNGYVEQVGTPYEIYNESKSEFVCDFIGDINRLKGELLSEVNTQSGANLDTNKTGFVRIERCISEEKAGYVKLTGKVEEAEFSGVLTKYVLECHGQELKYLEKNDGRRLYQKNEQIDLYINPQDIMQF